MREKRNDYKIPIRKPEGRNPLGISRRRWEGNIKWILKKQSFRIWIEFIWLWVGIR
jgi:hypothetical protein